MKYMMKSLRKRNLEIGIEENLNITGVNSSLKKKLSESEHSADSKYGMAPIKFIDLFAGVGGFRIGFEKAGFQCVFSSEWDKFAAYSYEQNFGEKPAGDIREISSEDIPDFDVLTGGFPCQPFSIAGVSKKNSLGRKHGFLDETQGTLFFEVARIIQDKRPKAFVLENVKNLLSHDRGRTFEVILKTLREDLGYHVDYKVLSSKHLVPQNRQRIFIVGFLNPDASAKFSFPEFDEDAELPSISSILDRKVDSRYTLSDKLWKYLQDYKNKHQAAGHGFGYGLVNLNGQARTLSARYYKDGSEVLIPNGSNNPRRLTPREAARLMGFPDSYNITVSDTQAYKQFGNAVVVPLVETVASSIRKSLAATEKTTIRPTTGKRNVQYAEKNTKIRQENQRPATKKVKEKIA